MPFSHGKDAVFLLNAVDISPFVNNVTFTRSVDSHDTTTYGQEGHTFADGLTNTTMSIGGIYDNGATGPHDVIVPLLGTGAYTWAWRPEGTGSALPEVDGTGIVTQYVETAPVAGMIAWTATVQGSGTTSEVNQT